MALLGILPCTATPLFPNCALLGRLVSKLQRHFLDTFFLLFLCRISAVSWFGGGGGGTSPGIVGGGGGGSCFVNTALSMDLVVLQGTGRIPGEKRRSKTLYVG